MGSVNADDRNQRVTFAEPTKQTQPVSAGQIQVEQHEIGPPQNPDVQSSFTVRCCRKIVQPEYTQNELERHPLMLFIIRDESIFWGDS